MNCGALITQEIAAAEQQFEQYQQEDILASLDEEADGTPSADIEKENISPPFSNSDGEDSLSFDSFDFTGDTDKMSVIRFQKYDPKDYSLVKSHQTSWGLAGSPPNPYNPGSITSISPRSMLPEPFEPKGSDIFIKEISTSLPRGFPKRPPDLVGAIAHVQSQVEHQLTPDSATFFLTLFRELIWSVPGDNHSITPRQVYVTTLRITTSDGTKKDARLEGYMRGVNLSLGDTVSLWGHKRHGLLRIYRGYNHTTEGKIKTSTTASFFWGLMIIVAALAFFLIIYWLIHLKF